MLGSDPGFIRLLTALQAVATIGVAMLAEDGFVRLTHALQIPSGATDLPGSAIAAQHHGVLVVAILLGAIVGMIASFSSALFPTPRALLVALALMPIPMLIGLPVGLALAPYRLPALVSFAVILAAGGYLRRFGPRGLVGGMLLFIGDFFGFFLHGKVALKDLGWLAAEIGIGVLVAIAAQFTLFYPHRRAALERMQNSYLVRAREVAAAALRLMAEDANPDRASRRLHRALVRLNETALTIDSQLAQPTAVPKGFSAAALHQQLFDAELALTNVARFAEQFAQMDLPARIRGLVRTSLSAIGRSDARRAESAARELMVDISNEEPGRGDAAEPINRTTQVVLHRFAISILGYTEATHRRSTMSDNGEPDSFESSVALFGGWLPGSTAVSATASLERSTEAPDSKLLTHFRLGGHIRLAPYSRVAIQMGVAVTGAIILGDLLSGRRFYWAVIAAFVTFMGANNSGEQLRKGALRLVGTVVGVLFGEVLAHLVGPRTDLAIAVILAALFLGLYLMRVSYAFFVVGITVIVSQLYVQLDEYSNSLLLLRLEETAIGAAFTALTVMFVFPLRTGRVARVATRQYIQALTAAAEGGVAMLTGGAPQNAEAVDRRAATRRLDAAYQWLIVTIAPLRYSLLRSADTSRERLLAGVIASRYYARNLLSDSASATDLPPTAQEDLMRAGRLMSESLGEIAATLGDHHRSPRTYTRSASRFDLVATALPNQSFSAPAQLALRDLQLLDGAMATLAGAANMEVRALDAVG